ncbi:MAG: thiamine-phosphate kinase [bacterium]|nr:thiamine-phosphate kinase [bacterium]
MRELKRIQRIRERAAAVTSSAGLVLGIGDDAAVFRPRPRTELVFTTDLMVEGVHFRRNTHTAPEIGGKTLTRGLSDIAAMGADPLFALVSLALPPWANTRWVDGFYRGFLELAERTRTSLAGGDLSRSDQLCCDVVVCGSVPRGKALRRDGARPGDAIYVSGVLGGSAVGLRTRRGAAWRRHRRPEPRLDLGLHLRKRVKATAAMDLSDGLSLDLHRLAEASGVAATIDRPLPVFDDATLDDALGGGEDYELLFTAGPKAKVPRSFHGVPLTRIGTVIEGPPGAVDVFGWRTRPSGWDHFEDR